jgi:hypothetical protein
MKLKQYLQIFEDRVGFDDIDQPFEDDDNIKNPESEEGYYFGDEDEESMYDDDDEDVDDADDFDEEEEESGDIESTESDEEADEAVMQHLASTIRNMISNTSKGEFYVEYDNFDISIQFVLSKTERFHNLMKIMGILKKIQTDILIQYSAEVDLWESKEKEPLFTVNFYYDSKTKGYFKEDELVF